MSLPSGVRAGANGTTGAASTWGSMKRVLVATGDAGVKERSIESGGSMAWAEIANASDVILVALTWFDRPSAREISATVSRVKAKTLAALIIADTNPMVRYVE